jgi:E3 ubiquitin-protein ligase listerin
LIRGWVLDCKDRGQSLAISTYTSNYFSPVIIRTELASVKSPEAIAELADDALTIKVNTLNEITASYLVDEHQLEIALKMPPDWPLHMVDVVDVKKVGVTDNIWRAWLLGIRKWSQVYD